MKKTSVPTVNDVPNEASPLLSPTAERGSVLDFPVRRKWASWQSTAVVTNIFMAVVLIASCGSKLAEVPLARIEEAIICYRYYERVNPEKLLLPRDQVGPGAIGGVFESLCKVDEVQDQLAFLNGWMLFLDGVPCLLLAIPFAWLSDKYGRWPIILVGMIALTTKLVVAEAFLWFWQSFDVRMIWLSALPMSLCGGMQTCVAVLMTSLVDITPESSRAGVLLRVTGYNLTASVLMPPLASWLMKYNPWIPALSGAALTGSSAICLAFLPETLDFQYSLHAPAVLTSITLPESTDDADRGKWRSKAKHRLTQVKDAVSFLTSDWRVPITMFLFVGYAVTISNTVLILQYMSKRYGLSLADANFIYAIHVGVMVLLVVILLPLASDLLVRKFNYSAQRKDLYLARASQALLATGWAVVSLSPNLILAAIGLVTVSLGIGGATLLRSLMSSLVPKTHIARTFGVLGIVETLGMMLGGPILAALYKRGLHMGGAWIGLPFLFLAVFTAACLLLLFMMKLRPAEAASPAAEPVEDDDDY